jgi:hypothetical protein
LPWSDRYEDENRRQGGGRIFCFHPF